MRPNEERQEGRRAFFCRRTRTVLAWPGARWSTHGRFSLVDAGSSRDWRHPAHVQISCWLWAAAGSRVLSHWQRWNSCVLGLVPQECLAYPLLRAEQLAGEGSTSAGSLAVQEGGSAVQQYCMEIMEAVLPQTLLPAAISESSDGLTADLAAAALRGVASRLAGTAGGSGGSAGEASQPLRLLLKLAGSFLSFAVQQSLEQGVEGVDPQVLEQGLGGGLVCFDRASGLVEQLADAAGEQQVRDGAAPAALWCCP